MKSKTSFFNWGISKNLLKRCWPLWSCYLAVLLLSLPVSLSSVLRWNTENLAFQLSYEILNGSQTLAVLSFVVCVLVAMAMFGYLYNARNCGMMNALPIRRESMFVTVYLTGLVPMLAADLLTLAVTAVLYGAYVPAFVLWKWFSVAVLCNVTFYGLAVFCAMLTGSMIILPAVYVVLNVAVNLAESAVDAVLRIMVYGYSKSGFLLNKLSPIVELWSGLYARSETQEGVELIENIFVEDYALLWVYGVAGLLLSFAALLLYRRRAMETASDTVAVPVLKPIFKYCLCFGGAGVFAAAIYNWFFDRVFTGFAAAGVTLVLLLTGAFLGYFGAEMLLQKSVRVFDGKWKGLIISCLILTAVTLCAELDVFGYERYVPETSEVESVELEYIDGSKLKAPENILAATELQRLIIDEKTENENADSSSYFGMEYVLKNGKTVSRRYYIASGEEKLSDPASALCLTEDLNNSLEARQNRAATAIPVTVENINSCYIYSHYYDENGNYVDENINLTPSEAVQLYKSCVLPDVMDSSIGSYYLYSTDEYFRRVSNTSFDIELSIPELRGQYKGYESLSLTVTMDAERTVKWINEHGGITLMPVAEAEANSRAVG